MCRTPSPDAVLAAVAARQHGLVTTAQLISAGVGNPGAIAYRVANGRLHRKYRGVYALGHGRLSREGEWMAAVLACGDGAVLSHLSAASMWGFWRRRVAGIAVLVPRRHRGLPGVRVRTCRHRLDRRDTTLRNGIPITTVPRTLVDLTDVLDAHQLANAIHEADFRKCFHEPATRQAIQRANGRHSLATLIEALDLNASGSAGTRSGFEDRFLPLVAQAGLPPPLVNTHVYGIEVDFHWPGLNLCVEVDGPGHARRRTKREDQARDEELRHEGQRVVRLAEHELTLETVIARLT
jgi:Transcriptional regulator, AbiEi antitoxin/Protein of unknown function (DUF559)